MNENLWSFLCSLATEILTKIMTGFITPYIKPFIGYIRSKPEVVVSILVAVCVSVAVVIYNICRTVPEPEPPPGPHYEIYDESLSWHEAKKRCEDLGGHLATITSDDEQAIIEGMLRNRQKSIYWIGLFYDLDTQMWRWVTDETFVYANWDKGQPNSNRDIAQNYAGFIADYITWDSVTGVPYKWHDFENRGSQINPLSNFGFICEWDQKPVE